MTLYTRQADGVTVEWTKEDEKAKQTIREITGKTDFPVKVDKETAKEIREVYRELKEEESDEE